SWIDLAEIRVNTTESRFVTCLNRLLQQNRPEEVLHDACVKPALSLLHPGGFDPDAAPLLQKPLDVRTMADDRVHSGGV
ncbi:hypothetical protein ABIB85_008024, partial [Bradyrhizobium sp. JR1.5]|uniref:hypothetical protein n=1 Tax=unclassified Bradyrhizobium TaxID=2631580 RepID=UPI003399DBAA